jgi:hypothetical protein
MRHFIQYHNYEKLRYLPERKPPFLEGTGYIDTSVKTIMGARGETAFLILGIGKPRRSFFLWERFEIESIQSKGEHKNAKERTIETFLAKGKGWQLIPPAKLEGKDFDEFRRGCADFVGFRAIDNLPYVTTLIALSEQNRKNSYNEELEGFCTILVSLAPDDGEVYYYRGLVRQKLGRHPKAKADFREASRLLTQILEYAMEEIPEEEREADAVVNRTKRYLDLSRQQISTTNS